MSERIRVYGADDCDDTERTVAWLRAHGVAFEEIDIGQEQDAERFVLFINGGFRSTPTLVVGSGNRKLVVTEPTDEQLAQLVADAGY